MAVKRVKVQRWLRQRGCRSCYAEEGIRGTERGDPHSQADGRACGQQYHVAELQERHQSSVEGGVRPIQSRCAETGGSNSGGQARGRVCQAGAAAVLQGRDGGDFEHMWQDMEASYMETQCRHPAEESAGTLSHGEPHATKETQYRILRLGSLSV